MKIYASWMTSGIKSLYQSLNIKSNARDTDYFTTFLQITIASSEYW